MANKQFLVDIDLNNNELVNASFQRVSVLPSGLSLTYEKAGWIVFHEIENIYYVLKNIITSAQGVNPITYSQTWVPLGEASASVGGGIFLMGVKSNVVGENATGTTYADDITSEDITAITVTNADIKFSLLALTGSKTLKPTISYSLGSTGVWTEIGKSFLVKNIDRPSYTITDYAINTAGNTYITFKHSDGATKRVDIIIDSVPIVNSAIFTTATEGAFIYPGSQSELANGAQTYVTITSNESIQSVTIYNEGIRKNAGSSLTFGSLSGNKVTVAVPVNYTAVTQGDEGVVLTVTKPGGATSTKYYSKTVERNTELVNFVKCNDLLPILSAPSITYPTVEGVQCYAIKLDTTAQITTNITNIGSIGTFTAQYSTSGGQLTFLGDVNTFESTKTVSTSLTLYNTTSNNYTLLVTRQANGRQASVSTTVFIASLAPVVTLSTATTRLISSPTGYAHTITATCNQRMNSVSLSAPGGGGILGANFTCALPNALTQLWTNTLTINDTIVKAQYSFLNTSAKNIAGLEVTAFVNNSYTVGGFTVRTATMDAFGRTVSFPNIAVTQTGYDSGKCIISWKGVDISAVLQPTGSRFAAGTSLTPSQSINNAWCIDAVSVSPRTTEVRFLNGPEAISSATIVTIRENA